MCYAGNLQISDASLSQLGKFQCRSDHPYIKYNYALLFLEKMSSLFFYASKSVFLWTAIVKD